MLEEAENNNKSFINSLEDSPPQIVIDPSTASNVGM